MSRRTLAIVTSTVLALVAGAAPASAQSPVGGPSVISLPNGFQPEGIAIGNKPFAYFGSRVDGDIYRADLTTGQGEVISQGPGTASLGMKIDNQDRLFVAGAGGGTARVVDTRTGAVLRSYTLQPAGPNTFINDVVLTDRAAWFTDSRAAVLFRLPLGPGGSLPAEAVRVPITGAWVQGEVGTTNANGIAETPDGSALIVVQSNTGKLFHITYDGVATEIDLGGELVPNGDGLWLRHRTLYVVQNVRNLIAKIELNKQGTAGTVVSRTQDPDFDVPTTIAEYHGSFYLPNARFTTTPTPDTTYTAVQVPIP